MIFEVYFTKRAEKDFRNLPTHIQLKFTFWVESVKEVGLQSVRKNPGWHDEPLKGLRRGQRSIRLSKMWRAIYVIKENNLIEFIEVLEINAHDY